MIYHFLELNGAGHMQAGIHTNKHIKFFLEQGQVRENPVSSVYKYVKKWK